MNAFLFSLPFQMAPSVELPTESLVFDSCHEAQSSVQCQCAYCQNFYTPSFYHTIHTDSISALSTIVGSLYEADSDSIYRYFNVHVGGLPRVIAHISRLHSSDLQAQEAVCIALGAIAFPYYRQNFNIPSL